MILDWIGIGIKVCKDIYGPVLIKFCSEVKLMKRDTLFLSLVKFSFLSLQFPILALMTIIFGWKWFTENTSVNLKCLLHVWGILINYIQHGGLKLYIFTCKKVF